ncbi:MAG: N-acetylmuramoyl-L-alanine amidase [Myxococcales bacterium]|nr:N-acetylmuramoyl-L-alanine amidase [Myxococcales bacterium]
MSLAPHVVPAALTETVDLVAPDQSTLGETMGVDYPGAEWFPTSCSGKCDATRGGNAVQYVVVHDTEGGWAGSVATLQNDPGKSVHYIVGTDGRVGQFVNETVCAWHAGNYPYNQRSIGIEHVGYWNKSQYTEVEYQKSAELVAYLTKKFGVAKDRAHIIGHDRIPASGSDAVQRLAQGLRGQLQLGAAPATRNADPGSGSGARTWRASAAPASATTSGRCGTARSTRRRRSAATRARSRSTRATARARAR